MDDEPILLSREQYSALRQQVQDLKAENEMLREWVEQEGERGDICTYNILKKVCSYCRCKRNKEQTP